MGIAPNPDTKISEKITGDNEGPIVTVSRNEDGDIVTSTKGRIEAIAREALRRIPPPIPPIIIYEDEE